MSDVRAAENQPPFKPPPTHFTQAEPPADNLIKKSVLFYFKIFFGILTQNLDYPAVLKGRRKFN